MPQRVTSLLKKKKGNYVVLATMNVVNSVEISPTGFSKPLSPRFYTQIVRPQMEYGLAINPLSHSLFTHDRSSIKVILHLANLPAMIKRVNILQAQFLFRFLYVPDNSLLGYLLPSIQRSRVCQWHTLSKKTL
ncbi:hypothetical protein BCV71DRAFT_242540 [Rhizopus microsporus]|uniref:Uncharacterized protein n=1 Tax=Rhizopus microsporus TaxID=58291 RepID=A0A1X0S6F9_RHIZD|nr:hypothetical protein BCV71DRAFT_242540 [Rhizopus microsporus]